MTNNCSKLFSFLSINPQFPRNLTRNPIHRRKTWYQTLCAALVFSFSQSIFREILHNSHIRRFLFQSNLLRCTVRVISMVHVANAKTIAYSWRSQHLLWVHLTFIWSLLLGNTYSNSGVSHFLLSENIFKNITTSDLLNLIVQKSLEEHLSLLRSIVWSYAPVLWLLAMPHTLP